MVVALGTFGYSVTTVCLFASYDYIAVGMATTILYLYPALVTVLSLIIYKESINLKKIISLIVSFIGVLSLIGSGTVNLSIRGMILALFSALFYSFYVIGVSHNEIKKLNSYLLSFYISLVVAISMLFIGVSSNSLNFRINFYSLVCIVLLAFISTVVALMAFLEGVRIIGPSRAAIFSNLEPLVSLILGFLILGEKITIGMALGSVLIIISILILSINKKSSHSSW
jgi:drug/metabolite transporter (DMT)-like permease